jgi:hypothetical protein
MTMLMAIEFIYVRIIFKECTNRPQGASDMTKQNTSGRSFNRLLKGLCIVTAICMGSLSVAVDSDNDGLNKTGQSNALTLTCNDLNGAYLYSQEYPSVYLGFFGSQYSSDSVMNLFGTYGSQYNSMSVRNTFGTYGSSYGTYSANNSYTSSPPKILKNGLLKGYLTTNSFVSGGVSLASIDSACSFTATSPTISVSIPNDLTNLVSLAYASQVALTWDVSSGATGYRVYQCTDESCSSSTLLGIAYSNGTMITSLNPSQTYYFAVEPFNSAGAGSYAVITVSTLADTTAPIIALIGDANVIHPLGTEFSYPGAIATDDVDAAVTVYRTGAVDVNTEGTYVLTYSASDLAGNPATEVTRSVMVATPDSDNDGVDDNADAFPNDPNETIDTDSDGIGNNADTDDDNDGVSDAQESIDGTNPLIADTDGDGYSDLDEVNSNSDPLDANSIPRKGLPIWLLKAAKDKMEQDAAN